MQICEDTLKFYCGFDSRRSNRREHSCYESADGTRVFGPVWQGKGIVEDSVTEKSRKPWGFLIAWEFRVRSGAEKRFEDAYGPQGLWAQLFMQGDGFVGTELIRDVRDRQRYLTLDLWTSEAAFEKFHAHHLAEYKAIDEMYESMTEQERELGRFVRVGVQVRPSSHS